MSEIDDSRLEEVLRNQQYIIKIFKRNEINSIKRWKMSYGLAAMLASLAINSLSHWVAVAVFILGLLFVILSPVTLNKIDDLFLTNN
ncbi:MAG: hypothetical protein ABR886_09125 [Dehalococcoidales bacterium]|jgi:hypothetical protein